MGQSSGWCDERILQLGYQNIGIELKIDSFLIDRCVDSCFGNGTKWISRNESQMWVSGNPLRSIPETTVHYFYRDMRVPFFDRCVVANLKT